MTRIRRLTIVAVLAALSFILMFFAIPIIPGADFLQLDLSILPILVALELFGLKQASLVLLLRSLLKILLNNQGISTVIGLPMNMLGVFSFILVLALVWRKKDSYAQYFLAGGLGTLALTVVMLGMNYFYAIPLYASFAGFDIASIIGIGTYLQAMVLPFNVIAGLVYTISFCLVWALMRPVVKAYAE